MKKLHIILISTVIIFCICGITSSKLMAATAPAQTKVNNEAVKKEDVKKDVQQVKYTYSPAKALDIVNNPNETKFKNFKKSNWKFK